MIRGIYDIVKLPFTLVRLSLLGLFFFTGCLSIVFNQFLFILFYKYFARNDKNGLQSMLNYTKSNFVILLAFCTSMFSSPTNIILSFKNDSLRKRSIIVGKNGDVKLNLDPRAIVIANHQIYSDWFFLWFLAYLNRCEDHFFIVMKKSLEKLPILGYGMTNYNFVFLSRNWEKDRKYMAKQFSTIKSLSNKFWMLIFPEGTNMSNANRDKSHKFAEKSNLSKNDSVLLPRVKGLYVACKELAPETTKILDFTIGYSQHGKDEMAQDIFTLFKIYILGESPKNVNILVDEYDLSNEIPELKLNGENESISIEKEEKEMELMNLWINSKWQIKENDMNYYYENGKFEAENNESYTIPLILNSSWEIIYVYYPTIMFCFAYITTIFIARYLVGTIV